ncbi:hypothetical protein OIU34_37225 [Pararhizobium sp. BT-229]|uniref:hypothetical protein n=1 Tax=Pararhizobium sp. BT-229 TaxID=2986923 RepID=UPI0021F753A6|nr:hypothetical protein [Pararhizobium sp. BT-229]MCV9967476.1 hypothetical protein [Pararhizobium sp. BT-229]
MSATGNRSKDLAAEYIKLGGKRRAVLDDNLVSTREWAEDTAQAEAFWRDEVESLPDAERKDVEKFLPGINTV